MGKLTDVDLSIFEVVYETTNGGNQLTGYFILEYSSFTEAARKIEDYLDPSDCLILSMREFFGNVVIEDSQEGEP